jgi:transcriptional regulator
MRTKCRGYHPPIDMGLAVLAAVRKPSQIFTQEQIAQACNCHRGRISQIEKAALRKIRSRLRWGSLKNLLNNDELTNDFRSGRRLTAG